MRAIAAVNDRFTAEAPLPEATQLLMQAGAVANMKVPAVPRAASRQTRRLRRAPTLLASLREPARREGATRFVRHRTSTTATFAARARVPDTRRAAMASRLLMAGSDTRRVAAPNVQALDLLRARATAMNVIGRLHQRFALNALDMRDGKPDIRRLAIARGRGLQHLIYA